MDSLRLRGNVSGTNLSVFPMFICEKTLFEIYILTFIKFPKLCKHICRNITHVYC